MKKLIALLLAAMMLLPAFALADTSTENTEVAEAAETETTEETETTDATEATDTEAEATEEVAVLGYEIDNETSSIVARMDVNSDESYTWSYAIDDETILQEINDTTEDEPGKWVAGFMPASEDASGSTVLRLYNAKEGADVETESAFSVSVYLTVESGAITVNGILENSVNWATATNNESVDITLPANDSTGYIWTYTMDDADMFTCTETYADDENAATELLGAGGTWTLNVVPTMANVGECNITFTYARSGEEADPAQTYSVKLYVDESGSVSIIGADSNYTATETTAE